MEPHFGFSISSDGFSYYKNRPLEPWRYYWDTMVFGPELAREYLNEDVLFRRPGKTLNLFDVRTLRGPTVVLMSPLGMFANETFSRTFETDEGLFYHALEYLVDDALKAHRETVTERLQLVGW